MTASITTMKPGSILADRRQAFRDGIVVMLPWLVGIVPFGLIVGVTAAEASLSTWAGLATGAFIYSGSAQLVTIELLGAEAAPAIILVTVAIMNARLALYSASLAPFWRGTSVSFRTLASYLIVDPSFVVGTDHYRRAGDRSHGHAYYLGAAATLWISWQAAIATGLTLGSSLPAGLHLEFVVPLFLIAEIMPHTSAKPGRMAAGVAAVVCVVTLPLPMHSGLVVAMLAGIGAATLTERRRR